MPIGILIGSLVPNAQKVGTWGMLPVMVLAGISGIFYPIQQLWGWVQIIAQLFPMYWLGLGMRSAFLPDAAAVIEIGGSWRPWQTVAVLSAWAIAGAVVAPRRQVVVAEPDGQRGRRDAPSGRSHSSAARHRTPPDRPSLVVGVAPGTQVADWPLRPSRTGLHR